MPCTGQYDNPSILRFVGESEMTHGLPHRWKSFVWSMIRNCIFFAIFWAVLFFVIVPLSGLQDIDEETQRQEETNTKISDEVEPPRPLIGY